MAVTLTSTAYSASPRDLPSGVYSVSIDYTATVTLSASANATVILGPKIPNQHVILGVVGSHSSGAATCPVDVGYDDSLSAFASQKTQGSNALCAATNVPFKVSVSDDAANLYRVVKFAATPGTDTAGVVFKYSVLASRDTF